MKNQKIKLLPRQQEAERKILAYLNDPNDLRPGIFVGPTGLGKSFLIGSVAEKYKKPILVLQPNKELLEQNLEKLELMGGKATVYSASLNKKELSSLTFATFGSVKGLAKELKDLGVETILIDECDFGYPYKRGSVFHTFVKELEPKKVVGYTATPFKLNSLRGSSQLTMLDQMSPKFFKHYIDIVQIQDVIKEERWSELIYVKHVFDTSELEYNSSGSDYTEESIKKSVQANGVNNNIFLRLSELLVDDEKRILVFVDSVESGKKLSSFIPDSAMLDSNTKKKDRDRIVRDFKRNKIRVVFNHSVLTVGFDYPELNHIMLGRPTNSLRLLYQKLGRGVRIHENKKACYIEDFCGNIDRFGFIEHLTLEEFEGVGWQFFNGDRMLTGCDLDKPPITKQYLRGEIGDAEEIWYGKFKGTPLNKLPKYYIEYQIQWLESLDRLNPKMRNLLGMLKTILGGGIVKSQEVEREGCIIDRLPF